MNTETRKMVGPLIRGMDAELAAAVVAAVEIDNPDSEVVVDDLGGYMRVNVPERCVLRRDTLVDELGYDFDLFRIEPALAGFAGRMTIDDNEIVWYLERRD